MRASQYAPAALKLCEHIDDIEPAKMFEHACRLGLEGIVAPSHPLSYQAFEVVQYFVRRGQVAVLEAKLFDALGPGDEQA